MHAVVAQRLDVRGEIDELDMLEHRLVHLVLVGGHLLLRATIDDIHLLGAEADRRAAAVHRGEAAAQNGDALADEDRLAEVDPLQEGQTG